MEETIDKYELFLDLYGRKRYENEMKQSCEKAEKNGRLKEKEVIVLNMLRAKYHLEEIARMTGLDKQSIIQLAQNNNLTIS